MGGNKMVIIRLKGEGFKPGEWKNKNRGIN